MKHGRAIFFRGHDLSLDEENSSSLWNDIFQQPVKIQHANEISGQILPNSCMKKIGEVNFLHLTTLEVASSSLETRNSEILTDVSKSNGNLSADRKDSIVTDAKFDLILASLQSLAVELERDFHIESETKFGNKMT